MIEPIRLSDVLGKPVVDSSTGERVGRAWDVRVRRDNKQRSHIGAEQWVATALVIKPRGALERLGFLHLRKFHQGEWRAQRETIAWERIERISPEAIVVRPD